MLGISSQADELPRALTLGLGQSLLAQRRRYTAHTVEEGTPGSHYLLS